MEAHLAPFNLFIATLVICLVVFACINQAMKAVINFHAVYRLFTGGGKTTHGQSTDERD